MHDGIATKVKAEPIATAGGKPPRLCDDVVSFEDMHEFLVVYSGCKQQMHITKT